MDTSGTKLTRYRQAAQKAADWLESRQSADGAIDPEGGIASVYKTSLALVLAGRLGAAWRLMNYIAAHYRREPGEFHSAGESDLDHAMAFYRNCYIVMAAIRLGRFDIASPAALERLYRHQHRSGGFLANLDRSSYRRIDPLFTAMGGWLCLYTGRREKAVRAGGFLLNLIIGQPQMPERFYFHTDGRTGRCITEFPEGDGISYFADRKRVRQHFFYAGAIMGFLSDLCRATGDARYLDSARTMFAFEQGMRPRGFAWPSKCKVGWGSALLYSVTGEPDHRRMAEKVADVTFLKCQGRDGSWNQMLFPLRDDYSGFVISAIELTAEFTFELCEIVKALSGGSSRPGRNTNCERPPGETG